MTTPIYPWPLSRVTRARIYALVRRGVPMFQAVAEVKDNPKPHLVRPAVIG
jgi:hypothetical protein